MTPTEVTRELGVDVAMRWGTGYDTALKSFVNIIATPKGGTHVAGYEQAVAKTMNEVLRAKKMLRVAEDDIVKDDALEGLVALPGGRDALFGGKVLSLAVVLVLVAAIGGLLSLVLLDLPVALPLHLLVVVLLGVVALPPIVVVDVVLALRLRARAALVPILALPVLVPQLVAATRGTSAALTGDALGALSWAGLLFAFAVVYTVVGLTIVPAAIE